MEEENKKEEFKNEEPKQKSNKVFAIVIVIIAMALTFGCGIILGQKLFEGNKENKNTSKENNNTVVDNKDDNTNTIVDNNKNEIIDTNDSNDKNNVLSFKEILFDNSLNKYEDENIKYINNEKISINDKEILNPYAPVGDIGTVYKIENNYLIKFYGTSVNSIYFYLINNEGEILQKIHELDDDSMIIADSDKYRKMDLKNNIIEVYGTRLSDGPSLVKENRDYYICDKEELSKANVYDDYVVIAEYQLIYANNKFEIKKGNIIKTLGDIKIEC